MLLALWLCYWYLVGSLFWSLVGWWIGSILLVPVG